MSTVQYIKNFLSDGNVGSITPTSKSAVQQICKWIDFDSTKLVVEYGPGGGVFSRYVLDRLPQDAQFIGIETNAAFVSQLRESIQDPRFHVINASAEDVGSIITEHGHSHADYIISGIPFSFFDSELKENIVRQTAKALGSNGAFLVYQFRRQAELISLMEKHIGAVEERKLLFNIPPLYTWRSRK